MVWMPAGASAQSKVEYFASVPVMAAVGVVRVRWETDMRRGCHVQGAVRSAEGRRWVLRTAFVMWERILMSGLGSECGRKASCSWRLTVRFEGGEEKRRAASKQTYAIAFLS